MDRFRPATEADVEAILALMRSYYAEDGYEFEPAEARQAVSELIRDGRLGCLWVAQIEGRIVGYLAVTLGFSLEYTGRDAFIDELFIEFASRGRGLGREAMDIADRHCRESGVRALHLEVEPERQTAYELYRKAGFVNHTRYLMTKRLSDGR